MKPCDDNGLINIVSVSAAIPHKNLDIIPFVVDALVSKYKIKNVHFHITLPETSGTYRRVVELLKDKHLEEYVTNHGRCSQKELALLYRKSDIAFLPTLLEVFSVSSLEAMCFDLPIVTTDFDFNREVIAEAGLYYKPKNAMDAAEKILTIIKDDPIRSKLIESARIRLRNYDDYDLHYSSIVSFLKDIANNNCNNV